MTIEYVRLPLVLNFFANGDRATCLFNDAIQGLFRAVLFEEGVFSPDAGATHVVHVPARTTRQQQINKDRPDVRKLIQAQKTVLGTSSGLLLNEMRHSPAARTPNQQKRVLLCSARSLNATGSRYRCGRSTSERPVGRGRRKGGPE